MDISLLFEVCQMARVSAGLTAAKMCHSTSTLYGLQDVTDDKRGVFYSVDSELAQHCRRITCFQG